MSVGLETHLVPTQVAQARWLVHAERLELLCDRVEMAVLRRPTEDVHDLLLGRAVKEAVQAFLHHEGDPRAAALRASPWFERIGERQARLGQGPAELADYFRRARQATQRGLRDAFGHALVGTSLIQLREALMVYLDLLLHHARRGMERVLCARPSGPEDCRGRLTEALFEQADEGSLTQLARGSGLTDGHWVPLIAIGGPLPPTLLSHTDVLHRAAGTEAVVPSAWLEDNPIRSPHAQVVSGPSVTLGALPEAINLTRRASELLSSEAVCDPRPVVPCSDLLGLLLIDANPVLVDLLVAKHLGPLEQMGDSRRSKLAGTLLDWLQHGLPANQLARVLDLPTQTVHSRLKTCREIFASQLDDPVQRLELIVALRAAVPRWTTPNAG